ncbi:MAG TPA: serine hydrolase [Cyclobacteriaceae bacterium]|nr:serine hydrolase [Cyclobacteriaceae bacterium]
MRHFVIILFFLPFLAGCDKVLLGDSDPVIPLEENLQTPPALNDGWETSDLASQQIDIAPIHRLVSFIQNTPNNIHSLVIIRNNKLVLESYYTGWHRDRVHALRSVSKTFMGTLTGIAIGKGHFTLDRSASEFLPEYAGLMNDQKRQIRIRHLLTMTSGINWDEKTYEPEDLRNDETAFDRSDERLSYLFEKNMAFPPGQEFEYNSALPVVEAVIIRQATGIHATDFADENLFKPLGITNRYWRTDRNDGYITAIGPLFLTPRDMAKLGQLYLDSGMWKGNRILSKQWVKEATTNFRGDEASGDGYAFHWWTGLYNVAGKTIKIYNARGSGGQYIFVAPDMNAVVVFTSGNYDSRQDAPVGMLTNIILPAMTRN